LAGAAFLAAAFFAAMVVSFLTVASWIQAAVRVAPAVEFIRVVAAIFTVSPVR